MDDAAVCWNALTFNSWNGHSQSHVKNVHIYTSTNAHRHNRI